MTSQRRMLWWLVAAAILIALLAALGSALAPFYIAVAIAFVLEPLCDVLERLRLPRTLAVVVVMAGFALVLSGAFVLLVPILVQQAADLLDSLPGYLSAASSVLERWAAAVERRTGVDVMSQVRSAVGGDERILGWIGNSLGGLLSSGLTVSRRLVEVGIVVVVVFFLLRDFGAIVARVDRWLPAEYADSIRALAKDSHAMLRGFVRGQGLVCLILGTFYAVALTLVGLKFGVLVGLAIGLISFIPYVGATIGLITSMSLALLEFDSWLPIGGVAAIFFVGQMVEGNVLVPVLVGEHVRLHPVWVILGLYLGGVLFGFFGVLLAVPITAVLGVFARHALRRYLDSPLHRSGP